MTTETVQQPGNYDHLNDLSTEELYNVGFRALNLQRHEEYDAAMRIARQRYDETLRYFQSLQTA